MSQSLSFYQRGCSLVLSRELEREWETGALERAERRKNAPPPEAADLGSVKLITGSAINTRDRDKDKGALLPCCQWS